MKYFIQTFGCQANKADSERIAAWLQEQGMKPSNNIEQADYIVINTCMVRESAENRVYGLVNNLTKLKTSTFAKASTFTEVTADKQNSNAKIVVTGCMVGMAVRDKSGLFMRKIRKAMPKVDEFLPIEEIGFSYAPLRASKTHAWVPISNGCNNFCTYCVVPFTRGREVSRPFDEIINEVKQLAKQGYAEITLLGQNVNSYGADLVLGSKNVQVMRDIDGQTYFQGKRVNIKYPALPAGRQKSYIYKKNKIEFSLPNGRKIKPVYVKHLGRLRLPTLFPYLLDEVCKIQNIEKVDFMSSNPWDFSNELIKTIQKNTKITRKIHLPLQSGDNKILKRMNRWYTTKQYFALISKIKNQISEITFSTDIIVGFPGETEQQFQNTVDLVKKIGFSKAYIAMYSDRPMTAAHNVFKDDVPYSEKKRRWQILEQLIN